jgi:hypothetical protein
MKTGRIAFCILALVFLLSACRPGTSGGLSGSAAGSASSVKPTGIVSGNVTGTGTGKGTGKTSTNPSGSAGSSGSSHSSVKPNSSAAKTPAPNAPRTVVPISYKAGQTYSLSADIKQNLTQTVGGQSGNSFRNLTVVFDLYLNSIDGNGNVVVDITCTSISAAVNNGSSNVNYNSSDGSGDDLAPAYFALVGQTVSYGFDRSGRQTYFGGIGQIYSKIAATMGEYDESRSKLLNSVFDDIFGEISLSEMVGNQIAANPGREVAAGETWDSARIVMPGLARNISTNYTFNGASGANFNIGLSYSVTSGIGVGPSEPGGASTIYNVSGSGSGEIRIDKSGSFAQTGSYSERISGSVDKSIPDDSYYFSMPIDMTKTVNYTITAK